MVEKIARRSINYDEEDEDDDVGGGLVRMLPLNERSYNVFVGDLSLEVSGLVLDKYAATGQQKVMVLMKTSKTLTQKKMVRRQLTVMLQRTILNILLVYVGNLAPEVTQLELHCHFHALGAGMIQLVRIQRDKGLGFVRYSTHAEAALAIQMGNAQSIRCGKPIKL